MARYALRRLLRGLITMWLVVTVVFVALRLSGDPAKAMLPDDASQVQIDAFNRKYGLDQPILVQYSFYLRNILKGDFGDSLRERRPVTELVHARMGNTLQLGLAGILIALAIGLPAGILAAIYHNRLWDRLLTAGAFLGQSLPNFFLGILLILLFSLQLRWLPSSGTGSWQHLMLPAFTLSTGLLSSMARMTRSSLLEVMRQEYVRTARAKGFSNRQVIVRHCLRNAAIPVLTLFGLSIGTLIGGAAITETIFAWPGIGRFAVSAISMRDYPLIQYIVLLVAASVVFANFLVDMLYGVIDPRIRDQRAGG
ncbi:MAG: ABC transporter permease [Caldilineaceae bacterium]|nr:ABC transporter permease [Caldilineaceae bacterium]